MPKSRGRSKRKMTARQDGGVAPGLAPIVGMVGEAIQAGASLAAFREVARAGLTETLIGMFFAEARKRGPRAPVLDGCAALLTIALDRMRLATNGGDPNARTALRDAGDAVERELARAKFDPAKLMLIVRAFALAELPPPGALLEVMAGAVEAHAQHAGPASPAASSPEAHFATLAEDFDHDPFAIHADMAASGAAFPAEQRFAMAATMALSEQPAVRAAAIGFLLDADEAVANALAQFLAEEGARKPAESILVERIGRLRPWLPPQRRVFVDEALAALRKTALAPVAPPPRTPLRWLATACDGAGAQSLFAAVKTGRKFAVASVLIKDEVGIADAWAATERPKREIDAMLAHVEAEVGAHTVTQAYVERRLADALALNIARAPPPYGLVQALEIAGLGPIPPRSVTPVALIEEMLAGVAELPRDAGRGPDDWGRELSACDTWFEAGEPVEALLADCETTGDRMAAMLDGYLPARRDAWMARLAWTAAALKESAPLDGLWLDLASAAHALGSGAPVANSPLMRRIAERSVEAFEARA